MPSSLISASSRSTGFSKNSLTMSFFLNYTFKTTVNNFNVTLSSSLSTVIALVNPADNFFANSRLLLLLQVTLVSPGEMTVCLLQIGQDGNIHDSVPMISGQIDVGECLAFALGSNFSKCL